VKGEIYMENVKKYSELHTGEKKFNVRLCVLDSKQYGHEERSLGDCEAVFRCR
jgi:hypothetical protein